MIAGNNLGKQSDLLIRLKQVSVKLHTFSHHVFEEPQYSQNGFYAHVVQNQVLKNDPEFHHFVYRYSVI